MPLIQERADDVVELSLDWPDVRNSLGPGEGRELRVALESVTSDPAVGAIVLSARGKSFCAGGNLKEILKLAEAGHDAVRTTIYGEFQGIFRAIRQSPVPVIAAVDGAAIGFGCDLALAGNATFIGSTGYLAQGWIKAGLIPATGGTLYVAERGGEQAVWRLLACDKADASMAESWGLAIACDNARTSAIEMAQRLASLPRAPLRAITQLARLRDSDEHLRRALEYQTGFITDPEFARLSNLLLSR